MLTGLLGGANLIYPPLDIGLEEVCSKVHVLLVRLHLRDESGTVGFLLGVLTAHAEITGWMPSPVVSVQPVEHDDCE